MRGPLPSVSRRGKVTIGVVAGALLLLIFLDQIVDLWTDWLWYSEVGYTSVFGGLIRTRIWLFILFGVGVAAFVAANLYLAFRLRPMLRTNSPEQQALERYRMILSPRIGLWIGLAAGLIGFFAGISGQGHWQQWLLFTNGGPFGVADPVYGADVGFYVFEYPFWRYLLDVGFTATALSVLGALAVHYVFGGVRLQGVGDRMSAGARAHLTALVALFVLLKAVAYFLDRRALLLDFNSGTGLYGAGYTDINAVLPAKEILAYISIVVAIAILVFSNVGTRNLVWAGASLALLGLAAVAIGGIYPAVVQQFTVKPNVRDREADYIGRTIQYTRQAYDLTNVSRSTYSARQLNPPASLVQDKTIVPTIRLLDPAVVNETYTQFQQIRSFYDFPRKLDVDRYMVDGRLQDFVVSVREINYDRLQGSQTNWPNRHTVYTHGYGFVAAPANLICDGQPVFVAGLLTGSQQNDACAAQNEAIEVAQPRIYYGELARPQDYVVVGRAPNSDRDIEFDRPAGDAEELFSYDGRGGVPVASLWRRMLYGLHFRDANFLLSDVFNDNSKVIYVRNPRERVERVAPFLTLDGDPYPAVVGGRVVWILDGYTTSATYPYSQRVDLQEVTEDTLSGIGTGTVLQARQNINYIRNSVKATVDAYDGTVSLYAFDESDPILNAWNKAFGGNVIKPKSEIPAELAVHFRYPEDLFKVQRDILSKFHVSDPKQFNSAQDFWQVPDDPATAGGTGKQPPYYLLTQFPGAQSQRFQLTAALTPIERPNLSALLTGVLDAEGRPRLELLELSRDSRIPGPIQAQQNMANDSEARSRINILSTGQGAQVVYANLLSLPYAEGLLYVQPVYVKSAAVANAFPKMSLVLVSYGNTVGFAETLQGAIAELVRKGGAQVPPGQQPPTNQPPTNQPPTNQPPVQSGELAAAIAKIDAALDKLSAAYRTGDFNQIGAATAELDKAIKEYRALEARANGGGTGGGTTATPTPTTSPPG
jgi:uncharacterized membrane protein (UPF0182 family)